ncbi:XRE family transcriptional regulator [Lentisphaerota bacterium WC36G]|nr:hypothetical protein LJT99_06865 [Lentisphaerae bacterium WC36]
MKITKEILEAMKEVAESLGGVSAFSEKVGISKSNVSRWLSGKVTTISDDNWQKLSPAIMPYMDLSKFNSQDFFIQHSNKEKELSEAIKELKNIIIKNKSEVEHTNTENFRNVPIVADASALEPGEYAENSIDLQISDEFAAFPNALESDIVVRVKGESMLPWYPDGTLLLVSTKDFPLTGDRVVVELATGEILFKIYIDNGDQFQLKSINRNNGEDITLNKRSDDFRKIYPVKMSLRDERKLDEEMNRAEIKHFWQD